MRVETLRGAERRSGYSPHQPAARVRSWTAKDVVRLGGILLLGVVMIVSWQESTAIGVLGAGLVGLAVLGVTIYLVRDYRPWAPSPDLTSLAGTPATVVHREHVAFRMGLVVLVDLVAVTLVWAVLAARDAPVIALVLIMPTVWTLGFMILVARGRFTAGSIWCTPDQLVYRSRGLQVAIRWDEIAAVDGEAVPALAVVHGRDSTSFTYSNVPALWRSERMASPTMAVIRTDDMSVDPGTLTRFIGRYALTPAARSELGTAASLEALESVRLTTTSGPLPNAFTRRRPESPGA